LPEHLGKKTHTREEGKKTRVLKNYGNNLPDGPMKNQGNGLLYWKIFLLVKLGCRQAVIELVNPLTA
jgi:hypothetical protein